MAASSSRGARSENRGRGHNWAGERTHTDFVDAGYHRKAVSPKFLFEGKVRPYAHGEGVTEARVLQRNSPFAEAHADYGNQCLDEFFLRPGRGGWAQSNISVSW